MNAIEVKKLFNLPYRYYTDERFYHYIQWCFKYANAFGLPQEALIKNEALYNWYCAEWTRMVENPFLNQIQGLEEVEDPAQFWTLLQTFPEQIGNYYPKPILSLIKKQINNIENDNVQQREIRK